MLLDFDEALDQSYEYEKNVIMKMPTPILNLNTDKRYSSDSENPAFVSASGSQIVD